MTQRVLNGGDNLAGRQRQFAVQRVNGAAGGNGLGEGVHLSVLFAADAVKREAATASSGEIKEDEGEQHCRFAVVEQRIEEIVRAGMEHEIGDRHLSGKNEGDRA